MAPYSVRIPQGQDGARQWSAGQLSRWGPPTGIARERDTSADDAAPYQHEDRTTFESRHGRDTRSAGRARNYRRR